VRPSDILPREILEYLRKNEQNPLTIKVMNHRMSVTAKKYEIDKELICQVIQFEDIGAFEKAKHWFHSERRGREILGEILSSYASKISEISRTEITSG
jgi:hypothetical protein